MSGTRMALALLILPWLCGCTAMAVTGAVVGAATAVAVEVIEVPFEVAAGVHDAVTDEDEKDEDGEG